MKAALAALGVLLALGVAPATAASFDCAKARTPDERAICADPALSALDSEMGGLWFAYSRLPMMMGASGARRDDAKQFLTERSQCGSTVACIGPLYKARIAALREGVTAAIAGMPGLVGSASPPPPAPQPVMDRIAQYGAQCRQLGGQLSGNAWPDLMTADLDHDGRPDYVLNAQNLICDGSATAFCANDGCAITVALSSAGYNNPLELRGSQPTLVQTTTATGLDLWVDRTNCATAAAEAACWGAWRWKGGKLTPSFTARPAP